MTDQEIIDIVQHRLDGGEVERCLRIDDIWVITPTDHEWDFLDYYYRKKPRQPREVWVNIHSNSTLSEHISPTCINCRSFLIDGMERNNDGIPTLFREVIGEEEAEQSLENQEER